MASAPYALISFFILIVVAGAVYMAGAELSLVMNGIADTNSIPHSTWDMVWTALPLVIMVSGVIMLWVNSQRRL